MQPDCEPPATLPVIFHAAWHDGRAAGSAGKKMDACLYGGSFASAWRQGFESGRRQWQIDEAWRDGVEAMDAGLSVTACPYDGMLREYWITGFHSGMSNRELNQKLRENLGRTHKAKRQKSHATLFVAAVFLVGLFALGGLAMALPPPINYLALLALACAFGYFAPRA